MVERHQSLLYLSYVVMKADGIVHSLENKVLEQLIELELISQDMIAKLWRDVRSKSLEELRKIGMNSLVKISKKDQINTLAWIHRMIHADQEVDVREARFLLYTMKPTGISISELEKAAKRLPF